MLPTKDKEKQAIMYAVVLLDSEACLFMLLHQHARGYYIKNQASLQRIERYGKLKSKGHLIAAYGGRAGFLVLDLNESTHTLELFKGKCGSSGSILAQDLVWLSDSELCILDIIGSLHIVRLHGKHR